MTTVEIGKTYEITFSAFPARGIKARTKIVTITASKPIEDGKTMYVGVLSGVTEEQLEADPWAADFSFVLPNEGVVSAIREIRA